MSKKNFVTLILSTAGGLLFALGMCMALLPEWNLFRQGILCGGASLVILLIMLMVRRNGHFTSTAFKQTSPKQTSPIRLD